MLVYENGVPEIPAAALAAEDADFVERLLARGETVRVELLLRETRHADVTSANVVAEVEGQAAGDEHVLAGAHLDTWDVSPGAHDNGAGIVMVIEALRILSQPGLRPKCSVRGVLFMSEETGSQGGIAYHRAHRHEKLTAVVETDHGAAAPLGFDTTLDAERSARFAPLVEALETAGILAPLDGRAARFEQHAATGVDTAPFRADGVPGFGLMPDPRSYFDLHHTAADRLDKVDPSHLARCLAAFTSLVWFIAEYGVPRPGDGDSSGPA